MAKRYILSLVTGLVLLFVSDSNVEACDGTFIPPCGRSIFLAKFTPATVVLPAAGPVNVPIGVLPFVTWNNGSNTCGQPVSATLTLTLTCTPIGGVPTVIGPQTFQVPTPTVPGPQPLAAPVTFVILAGTLPAGIPALCTVVGTYTVNFSGGSQGNGPITATGDVEVCLVPASPADANLPRLSLEYISLDSLLGIQMCRRGDQAYSYFLLANNDPDHSVELSLSSVGRQVAGLPDGIGVDDAYGMDVFAIASTDSATDTFPAAFAQDLAPGELLHGDPAAPTLNELSDNLTLQPNEATIICIAMRSFGMCALGSCNERSVKVTGQFDDGSSALACASTVMIVADVPGKNSLCEFEDLIKVAPNVDAVYSPAVFSNQENTLHHAATHSPGSIDANVAPAFSPFPGTLLRGESFGTEYPSSSTDIVRITEPATQVSWQALFYAQRLSFVPVINNVTVIARSPGDLGSETLTSQFPMIGIDGMTQPQVMDIIIDISVDTIEIFIQDKPYHRGAIADFPEDAPRGTFWDLQTCRQIAKTADFSDKSIFSDPRVLVANLFDNDTSNASVEVFDQAGNPVTWTANVRGSGITLPALSGQGTVMIDYDLNGLVNVPETNLAFLEIMCPGAINNPLIVPAAIRVSPSTAVQEPAELIPTTTRLYQNYPNPFNPMTTIQFDLHKADLVSLRIYDLTGRVVRTVIEERLNAGSHVYMWDGRDNAGTVMAGGVYLARLSANGVIRNHKMILLK